jgi:hypothetical protein
MAPITPNNDTQTSILVGIADNAKAYFEVDPKDRERCWKVEGLSDDDKRYYSPYFHSKEGSYSFPASFDEALMTREAQVRAIVWEALKASNQPGLLSDYNGKVVRNKEKVSPWKIRDVLASNDSKPAKGWGLVIAMHGGGGRVFDTPLHKSGNDTAWDHMFHYYFDQELQGYGYRYLSLRAPDNIWNGFYTDYMYPLIDNLVRAQLLYGDIDPNRVYVMGCSHGGYGAFAIGSKMTDRFAHIHAGAAAPTEGEFSLPNLRNTPMSVVLGGLDTKYGRLKLVQQLKEDVAKLKREPPAELKFPMTIVIKDGVDHKGTGDWDAFQHMVESKRDPIPKHLTWKLTDTMIDSFFWLGTSAPAKDLEVEATLAGNKLEVETGGSFKDLFVYLDGRLVNLSAPLELVVNGTVLPDVHLKPTFRTLCDTMWHRGDSHLAFSVKVAIPL